MRIQLLLVATVLGGATAATPYAELTPVTTSDSSASAEHEHFTFCAGDLYFSMTSVDSANDSIDGIYRFDPDNKSTSSTQLVSSVGMVRGLTCHHHHLYYYRRGTGTPWGFYQFDLETNDENFIGDALNYSHDTLVDYDGELFIGGRGPKLYKLILSTDEPTVGVVWEGPSKDDKIYPQSLAVHRGEVGSELFFVAPDEQDHPSLWKFNVADDQATLLKDLVLRTGDDKATIAEMISYKGPQDFKAELYFSLGGFERAEGHHRLATWDPSGAGSLPVITLVDHYDPSHMTIYNGDLYMVLRNPKDLSKFAVWVWNGRFVKKVFHLPNEGRITSMAVWDDILVASGDSGPMVVWNGDSAASVSATTKLSSIGSMISNKGVLMIAATEDPADKGNKLFSLNKGVWKNPHSETSNSGTVTTDNKYDSTSSSSAGAGSDNTDSLGFNSESKSEGDRSDTSGTNAVPPTWTKEISGSGGMGGAGKFFIVVLVFGVVGGLGWYAYKSNPGIVFFDSGSKTTWTDDEFAGEAHDTWTEDEVHASERSDEGGIMA
mmetsp:Transcript_11256/g.23064  ORF Transcript_11256/g.23064 Transcript_11256/m.23064 type:complete len:547 (+) Transcript_11256:293-1933(+)